MIIRFTIIKIIGILLIKYGNFETDVSMAVIVFPIALPIFIVGSYLLYLHHRTLKRMEKQ